MEERIIWKDIKEATPKEGQLILYSFSYEYEPGEWERRVMLDRYYRSDMRKYPMCYVLYDTLGRCTIWSIWEREIKISR